MIIPRINVILVGHLCVTFLQRTHGVRVGPIGHYPRLQRGRQFLLQTVDLLKYSQNYSKLCWAIHEHPKKL